MKKSGHVLTTPVWVDENEPGQNSSRQIEDYLDDTKQDINEEIYVRNWKDIFAVTIDEPQLRCSSPTI